MNEMVHILEHLRQQILLEIPVNVSTIATSMLHVTESIKLLTTLSVAFDDYGSGIYLGESFRPPHRAVPRLWINAWRSRLHRPPLRRPSTSHRVLPTPTNIRLQQPHYL